MERKAYPDDAAYLQALLDRRGEVRFPEGEFELTRPLLIYSHTSLIVPAVTTIRLADGANCSMLDNAGYAKGERDRCIRVSGGIWDGNNAHQTREKLKPVFRAETFFGTALRFFGVDDLTIRDLTIKDPESYSMHLADVRYFTVEHIRFEHNLLRANMDGVHVNGPARFGRIADVKGATNDDLVALNCDDGVGSTPFEGDITDVEVDGLYAEDGYTAVRLLSCGSVLRNVSISNVFGTYRFYTVSFTQHNVHPGAPSLLENVSIRNVFAAKPAVLPDEATTFYYAPSHKWWVEREPLFFFADGTVVKHVTISDVRRFEEAETFGPTLRICEGAAVEDLTLRNFSQTFTACEPVKMLDVRGKVEGLKLENVQEK